MLRSTPPRPRVCEAFGVASADPTQLHGGRGGSWRVGPLVLKVVGDDPVTVEEVRWVGTALESTAAVRVAVPVPATDGRWVVDGWSATRFLPGAPAGDRWADVLEAGRAFASSTSRLPRPTFLSRRRSPWDTGDRMAWGDEPLSVRCEGLRPLVDALAGRLRDVDVGSSQLVHADLGGNVLLAEGLPPAVIDVSPYWRPPAWALAVVAIDAMVWSDADPAPLLGLLAGEPDIEQMLLRAMLFRLVTDDVLAHDTSAVNQPTVDLLLAL